MDESDTGEFSFLPERTCAICYQDQNPSSSSENEVLAMAHAASGVVGSAQTDITNPYEAIPCEHIYCFVCIATRLEAEEGEGFSCLRCGGEIKECKPWSGDVAEEISRPGTGKSVTFADDAVKTEETKGQDRFDPADDSGYQTGSGNEHGQV